MIPRNVDLRQVAVDANVLISSVLLRDETQRAAAGKLIEEAERGELIIILPQFIVFEAIYVLRTFYKLHPLEIGMMLRDAMALTAVALTNDCPWPQFFEHWSNLKPSPGDAAILALALAKRYDLATFDRKLANRAETFGVASYW
jgi:predicted nucleic acid-binding protein